MPYGNTQELPSTFGNLPAAAKRIALEVVNDRLEAGDDEQTAIKKAWGAVKRSFRQEGEEWVAKDNELKTVNIVNFPIWSTGTFNGDEYTLADLHEMKRAHEELPLKPFAKLGHDPAQKVSGAPAVGWIENLKVDEEEEVLYADVMRVPEKLGELIKVGGYRTRSPEIFWDVEYEGEEYPRVLKAVAFLGSDLPANPTLDDYYKLYGIKPPQVSYEEVVPEEAELRSYEIQITLNSDNGEEEPEDETLLSYDDGEISIDPDNSQEVKLRKIEDALRNLSQSRQEELWVRWTFDSFVIASQYRSGGDGESVLWVVPFSWSEGEPEIAPRSEWVQIEENTTFSIASYEGEEEGNENLYAEAEMLVDRMQSVVSRREGAPELRGWAAEVKRRFYEVAPKTQEDGGQAVPEGVDEGAGKNASQEDAGMKEKLYEELGFDADTPEEEVIETLKEYQSRPESQPEPDLRGYVSTESDEFKTLQKDAESGRQASVQLYEMERKRVLDKAETEGKFDPADRETWQKDYDDNPELVARMLDRMKPVREYGQQGSEDGKKPIDPNDRSAIADRAKELIREYEADSKELDWGEAVKLAHREASGEEG